MKKMAKIVTIVEMINVGFSKCLNSIETEKASIMKKLKLAKKRIRLSCPKVCGLLMIFRDASVI